MVAEPWQLDTTERNLRLIREMRTGRGEDAWIGALEEALRAKRSELEAQHKQSISVPPRVI
jgi:hypothetical protein